MSALWFIFRIVLQDQRKALLRGAVLSFAVLAMGAALLGVSGWFITAASAAGLIGMGAVFDVFRPSAAIRFLALGRTAARYGERMLSHDATLRALESLRLRVLRRVLAAPFTQLGHLRGPQALARLTADIDALDGVSLRLVLPFVAALATHMLAFGLLWWLVGLPVALFSLTGWLVGSVLILVTASRRAVPLSRQAEAATQALRARMIDMVRSRDTLTAYGRLRAQADFAQAAEARQAALRCALDRVERRAGAAQAVLATLMAGGALWIGALFVTHGVIAPAIAALGFFTMLGLAETVAPLRRAIADLGRMTEAARRVRRGVMLSPVVASGQSASPDALIAQDVTIARPGTAHAIVRRLSFSARPGDTLALTGPSGCGKSTVLQAIAGLVPVLDGTLRLGALPVSEWGEHPLREAVTYLPQRSALMAGTVGDALRLAQPGATDADLWAVLDAVALGRLIRGRGGLGMMLGPRGEGLSGGEARRLTLARALLRRPALLLLDEPTEGLDDATAKMVLAGLRAYLPDAMIVLASHHPREAATADRIIALG
ncbi:MAG: ABC-type thiol reductant export system component CydC [Roseibaca calidilacus]|uniref:ABC-type thiol reductant export system component CydC n=1 Tax=Roseibaca calidilacus TaxID=1666912 RepID=A0A0P7WH52_9RHOB|nr:ATP-binding cassette domain-containing protein [Roseibaca calidilacus]KPP89779.1 MAG: ABC-type thiol reductant export system component CydC [Roseibaca calidilacus]CUX80751.1 ATP-binding cassette, subfamily C, CydC [Roseibaca calidilacus]